MLHGILPDVFFQHHLLLVESVFLLLQDVVGSEEIAHSTRLVQHYCFMFSSLYGNFHTWLCNSGNIVVLP